jgi:hypothetical protein
MTSKKGSSTSSQTALKIGSRVRCTDDGVQGRITWANAVAVKVQWDDGEHVTWRRDALANRPIEILDPADDNGQDATNPEPFPVQQSVSTEVRVQEPSLDTPSANGATTEPQQPAAEAAVSIIVAATQESPSPVAEPAQGPAAPTSPDAAAETPIPLQQQRTAVAKPKEKKLSALEAAAKVLAESGQAMSCQELIAAMSEKGYWNSPGGKTPAATLYAALLRELQSKGPQARFVKSQRGTFALRDAV